MTAARAAAIQSRYVVGNKLKVIPAKRNNKLVVFHWLAQRFEIGRNYTEAEVNKALSEAHADFATLRRGLYDEYFLNRADGYYWRTLEDQKLVLISAQ
ncbi:MAG: DUF2087 domain-containing protein [Candidatus Eremiobacteraeota bacterium]|nr:DUF2087 domain-containing protein [Candidatus Eremiobacteraeota bacterium]